MMRTLKLDTYGILHNDIRPENIIKHRYDNGIKVCFIDFAMSKRTSNKRELQNEIIKLEELLRVMPDIEFWGIGAVHSLSLEKSRRAFPYAGPGFLGSNPNVISKVSSVA